MEINTQVVFREHLQNCTRIRTGTILSFKDETNKVARVALQDDLKKGLRIAASAIREIPVEQLETSTQHFGGRAVVHANPLMRGNIKKIPSTAHGCLANSLY